MVGWLKEQGEGEEWGSGKNSLLLGPHGMHTLSEFLGLRVVGQLALHPDHVGVGCVRDGSVDRTLAAALVSVVTFPGTRGIPVPVDIDTSETLGDGAALAVRFALGSCLVLCDQTGLVDVHACVDGVDDGIVEQFQTRLLEPLVFDDLELVAVLAGLLGRDHEVVQGLEVRVRRAQDESVVSEVDRRGDQGGGFGIGTCHGEQVDAHDVGLGTDGHQSVDVFGDGD